ncbi:dispanin subfamily A member 2b-like [Genypterus blacodes]|uniref:dispanin subfamily A member 2b-like n=1 Tax=Genypterus blacodes TaxID=154954 RepID=UPI003F76801A
MLPDYSLEEEVPAKAGGTTKVQYTVVDIRPELKVRDHLIWSLFTLFYYNICCLGMVALSFSVKARDRKVAGDRAGAKHHGSSAFYANVCGTILMILLTSLSLYMMFNARYYYTRFAH